MKIRFLIIGLSIFSSILYGSTLFVIWVQQSILNKGMTSSCYITPLFIIAYSLLMLFVKFINCDNLYCAIYMVFALYLGYLLYAFLH